MYPDVWDKAAKSMSNDITLVAGTIAAGLVIFGGAVALGARALVDVIAHRHRTK